MFSDSFLSQKVFDFRRLFECTIRPPCGVLFARVGELDAATFKSSLEKQLARWTSRLAPPFLRRDFTSVTLFNRPFALGMWRLGYGYYIYSGSRGFGGPRATTTLWRSFPAEGLVSQSDGLRLRVCVIPGRGWGGKAGMMAPWEYIRSGSPPPPPPPPCCSIGVNIKAGRLSGILQESVRVLLKVEGIRRSRREREKKYI